MLLQIDFQRDNLGAAMPYLEVGSPFVFKRLGERVMARTFERQVVELQVRVALLNRFTQLGRPVTVPVAWVHPG